MAMAYFKIFDKAFLSSHKLHQNTNGGEMNEGTDTWYDLFFTVHLPDTRSLFVAARMKS